MNKSEFIKGLFSENIIKIDEHVYENRQVISGEEILYGFIIWII